MASKGQIRDERAIATIADAYATIATTNVTPYYELDRALFEISEGLARSKTR